MKSRLLTHEEAVALQCTTDEQSSLRAAAALGIETEAKRFARLISRYRVVLHSYPDGERLIRGMLQLHEIENLKIAWRGVTHNIDARRWSALWRGLEDLGTLDIERLRPATLLYDLAESVADTPFGEVAREVYRTRQNDLASAELAFDRWASQQLLNRASELEAQEQLARDIVTEVVRERDDEIARRGATAYGLSEDAIEAARVLPRRLHRQDPMRLCQKAFVGQVTRLGPALGFLVFAERDYQLATALVERRGESALDGSLDRIIGRSTAAV